MKSLFVVVLAINAVTAENLLCKPKSYFWSDCNLCTCSPDGKTAACTDMICPGEVKNYIDTTRKQQFCEPGKRFKLDHFTSCICSADGTVAECTLGFNFFTKATKKTQYCTPGKLFSPDNCNICKCSNDGSKAMCTLKLCANNNILDAISNSKQVCEPRSNFKEYCNSCFCDDQGLTYACTKMFCDKNVWNKDGSRKDVSNPQEIVKSAPKQVCEPLSQFKDYCNSCFCADDGLSYACTRMMCDENIWNKDGSMKITTKSQDVAQVPNQVCKPGSRFNDYCNMCFCTVDGSSFSCTRMMCDKAIWNKDGSMKITTKSQDIAQVPKQVCKPGSRFNDYCNMCFCMEDGSSFSCTRMMCDKAIWNKDGSMKKEIEPKICTPNAHFQEYCNSCTCSSDGLNKACTMMYCDKNVFNKDGSLKNSTNNLKTTSNKVCESGKAFSPDNCNTCVCNEYGTEFGCTMKLCLSTLKQAYKVDKTGEWGPKYTQGDTCTPGKFFYSECNRCVCMATGTGAFCTLMDCSALASTE